MIWYSGYENPLVWTAMAVGVAVTLSGVTIGMLIKPPRLVGLYLRGFDKNMGPSGFHDAVSRATRFIRIGSLYHFETNPLFPRWVKFCAGIPSIFYAIVWMSGIRLFGQVLPEDTTTMILGVFCNLLWGRWHFSYAYRWLSRKLLDLTIPRVSTEDDLKKALSSLEQDASRGRISQILLHLRKHIWDSAISARSTDELWRDAVIEFAKRADVILVDITSPGEGLVWELDYVISRHAQHALVISQNPECQRLTGRDEKYTEAIQKLLAALMPSKVVVRPRGGLLENRRFHAELDRLFRDAYLQIGPSPIPRRARRDMGL